MQPGQSLPYMNLSRQVQSLDHTVQMLIQYQRLLYIELLQIKKKLGMDETDAGAGMHQQPAYQAQAAPQPRVSSSRTAAPAQSQSSSASVAGRPEDLDISAIQRALGMSGVKN